MMLLKKKKAKIFTFPPKFYSYLKQQDQLLAYSKKGGGGKDYLPAALLRITQNLYKNMLIKPLLSK